MNAPQVILGPQSRPHGSRAGDLVSSFAARHVPLPAALADSLAEFLASRRPVMHPVWGGALRCMTRALGGSGAFASQALVKGALDRFLLVVAEPILREAARKAGVLPLALGATGAAANMEADAAESEVVRHALGALRVPEVMGRPFWVHAALDLHLAARDTARARVHRRADTLWRECDPPLTALVFLHPPQFPDHLGREKTLRKPRRLSRRNRSGIRPKEGGVRGIRPSRNIEDLPDVLMSELMLPRPVMMARLVQEGVLVRHRPPRRDPRRDLLAVTLHEAAPGDGMGLFVKAAWADAAMRLQLALHQMGLTASTLCWSEAGLRPITLDVDLDLPSGLQLNPRSLGERARADLLLRSGLFPDFAARPDPDRDPRPDSADTSPEDDRKTMRARRLREVLTHLPGIRPGRSGALAQEYGWRLALLTRPYHGRHAPDWGAIRAEMVSALGPSLGRSHYACLVWQATGVGEPPVITAMADGRDPAEFSIAPEDGSGREARIGDFMGQLVAWIMDVTLEAVDAAP